MSPKSAKVQHRGTAQGGLKSKPLPKNRITSY